jgi:sec-independent protein translocase protein TatA
MIGTFAPLAFLGGIGPTELLFVLLILVLIFGARRLPEIGRGLGEGIRSFRGAVKELPGEEKDSEEKKKSET